LLELAPLLTHEAFRSKLLKAVKNRDVREYFENRFEPLSDAMKAVMRDPILNKTSEFTSDPHYKLILGQVTSTFSFLDVLNDNKIVLIDLNRGKLGKHASTLGSLILALLRPAIFRRTSRTVFTVYADEVQNLLTSDTDFDVYFAEARKFGVSICTANQFLDQFPKRMRAAIQAIGTHIFFQLSASDSQEIAQMLGGGHPVAEHLKNLGKRELIVKSGNYRWQHLLVPDVRTPKTQFGDLLKRSQALYARPCTEVSAEIERRRPDAGTPGEVLDDWQ
jgi:hypothetical protein